MKKTRLTGRVPGFGPIPRLAHIFALALAIFIAPGAWADITKDNPVTSESETYDYQYVGSGTWTTSDWENANGEHPTAAPGTDNSELWGPMLVDKAASISVTKLNGWMLQLGVFGGANVTVGELGYWTGNDSCFAAVDDASSLTISATTGKNWNNTVKFYVANRSGITFTNAFAPANPNGTSNIHYYLKGSGSVTYSSTLGGGVGHVIKQADVSLTGTSQVSSKTLVSFASTTKTFTADAAIKVYGTDGTTLATTVNLATVNTTGTTTLTTDNAVGTCELVQTATGIDLYWVDGDPAAIVPKTYTPSININFTSGTALSTAADVGLAGYAVPGTSWNNLTVANNATLSSLNKIDSTGAVTASSASVTITNTRGEWHCSSLVATSDLRAGYIDETADVTTPTVTVSGIPYDQYKVVVYTATDAASVAFGYVTINGTDYTYSDGAVAEGTAAWGASGAQNTAEALAEGVNVLVSPVVSGGTLTVVGHRSGNNPRGCIAAVQIVKVEQEVGENDLLIELDGDRTYTFSEAKTYSGTVYVTGEGTLTFDGAASTAATLHIGPAAAVNMVGSALTPTTVTGNGTVVYDGVKPTTGLGWTDSANWTGTVWVKNITTSSDERKDWNPALYGNAESTLRFTDVNLYFPNNTTTAFSGTVELDAGGLNICDGYGGTKATFAKLTGSGTLSTGGGSSSGNGLMIRDASEFTGTITLTKYKVIIGSSDGTSASGVLQIDSGAVATVASGKTWTAPGGFVVNGTLNADGTLASSHASQAVSGSGMVVFAGKMPSPTTDAWWKNAAWTGTVQIKSAAFTGVSGVNTYLDVNKYGNDGSVLELNNCSGWLPVGNTTGDNVCAVPLKVTGTLTINDGYSNRKFTINKLLGNGAIYTTNNGATVTIQVLSADDFTGYVNLNSKRVIFGETVPETFTSGQIYVGEGFTFTVPNSNVAWYGTGGITLAGELKAAALSNFGGGTTITTTDTGVFTLTSTGNGLEGETDTDYARIRGTGSLKYDGTGWRALSANNFPTAVTLVNEQAGDILLSRALTYTVGSLAGSKNFQGNYGSGNRYLNVIQSKDTEWSGKVVNDGYSRFAGLKLDASSTGTLTLSGTASQNVALEVNGGAVNLTGTWKGATTVAGTFGGTGTLTGNLTFSDGATFKAFASGLAVSGSVAFPTTDDASVSVDLRGITLSGSGTTLITTTGGTINDISKLSVSGAVLALESEGAVLKAYPIAALVERDGTPHFYDNIAQAMSAAMLQYSQTYDHFELYASIGETVSLDATWLSLGAFKLKTCNGATVTVQAASAEYSAEAGEADENEIVTYTGGNAATTYTWNWSSGTATWNQPKNWTYGNGTTATRAPVAGDTVVFNDGATVTLIADAACAAMTVNGAASISGAYNLTVSGNVTGGTGTPVLSLEGVNLSLSASSTVSGISLVLADANATLVVPSSVMVPAPTTNVARSRVKTVTEDGTTTYSVEAIPGTTFTVY